jgi:hypothetical protein
MALGTLLVALMRRAKIPGTRTARSERRMIEVKWELQDRLLKTRAELGAVGKVLRFYSHALAGATCPIHEQEPWLTVSGGTLESLTIRIEACCAEALAQANMRVASVSRRGQD